MNSFGSRGETEQSHIPYSCSDSEQRIEHFTTMSDTNSFSTSLTSQALGQALVNVSDSQPESGSKGEFVFLTDEEDNLEVSVSSESGGSAVFPSDDSCSSDEETYEEAIPEASCSHGSHTSEVSTSVQCIAEMLVSKCCKRNCLMHLTALDVINSRENTIQCL